MGRNPVGLAAARVHEHRARWAVRRILPSLQAGDRLIDIGAGDCRVPELLSRRHGHSVTPVDVEDFNTTSLELTLFDGERLPFADDSFDVGLLLFVLHHARDARRVLAEAARVCRRKVIVFEDVNQNWLDRMTFRGFHHWLKWAERIEYPFREWSPDQWTALATEVGLKEQGRAMLGRDLGPLASRHVAFHWTR